MRRTKNAKRNERSQQWTENWKLVLSTNPHRHTIYSIFWFRFCRCIAVTTCWGMSSEEKIARRRSKDRIIWFNIQNKFTRKTNKKRKNERRKRNETESTQKHNLKRIVPRLFTFNSKMRRAAGVLLITECSKWGLYHWTDVCALIKWDTEEPMVIRKWLMKFSSPRFAALALSTDYIHISYKVHSIHRVDFVIAHRAWIWKYGTTRSAREKWYRWVVLCTVRLCRARRHVCAVHARTLMEYGFGKVLLRLRTTAPLEQTNVVQSIRL